jgi:hypothetical protein
MSKFEVVKYSKNGTRIGAVAGMGRNKGKWDTSFKTLRTARCWATVCRKNDPDNDYVIEEVGS